MLLPSGIDDFKDIIEGNYYYIDKTGLIGDLLRDGANVILITRPRRFGKSLNFSMIKYFFSNERDYSYLFRGLKIEKDPLALEYMNKYPVIHITFKDAKVNTWEDNLSIISEVLRNAYKEHIYLLKSEKIFDFDKEYIQAVLRKELKESEIRYALSRLTEYLEAHFGKKVILLIDEYDVPIESGYVNGYYEQVVDFMRGMLTAALKGNPSLFKGLLTGVYRVAKEDIFSGLNNLVVYTILDDFYSNYFGFTEEEVKKMLSDFNMEDRYEEIKEWYDGYFFGGAKSIYNPWSVINYISMKQPQAFWVNTSSNDLIRNLITESGTGVKEQISRLIAGEDIKKDIKISTALRDITYDKEAVWGLFLFSGYLTAKEKQIRGLKAHCTLAIPNKELRELYIDIFETWLKGMELEPNGTERLFEYLFEKNSEAFEREFNEILLKVSSYHTFADEAEKVYQAFVLGMLSVLGERYEVKSERESGFGRYDVVIIDRKVPRAIIMEFKVSEGDPAKDAQKALEQIESKKYEADLRDRGIENIVKAGIAFKGKSCSCRIA
ncbi:PD-(D/E)XK nuclease superfamily protein [Caldanaerovirga acetigignens]|uniref:PD-(D/E)XK nuclease superfamily protein n=1 Tax=Caldanaerovirga acetigignens TaxID=447595 RepID=A0A1M7MSG8_9FIRM|nr:AAA family ATPase [Caldanaerovirga acetigignens]SHM93501.1 PD-(D/E)XK nuclease superfamily protein [Caldanaerovirga acetigignens]